jgi:hypothetical protein
MQVDKRGNADVTRNVYTPVSETTKKVLENWKLGVNEQIAHMNAILKDQKDPEVIRLIKLGITNIEQASMWFVKGLTTEGFTDGT